MKTYLAILLIATSLQSCNSKHKNIPPVESEIKFDLAKLSFNESIEEVAKASGIKLIDSISTEKTLFGYESVETGAAQVLNFGGVNLSGKDPEGINKVIMHYSEADKKVGIYELRLYTAKENAGLVKLINKKIEAPLVEKNVMDDGTGANFKQVVWHKDGIIYLLLQEFSVKATVKISNLAVFKDPGKDFFTLLGQKGYAIDPKALIEEALKKEN